MTNDPLQDREPYELTGDLNVRGRVTGEDYQFSVYEDDELLYTLAPKVTFVQKPRSRTEHFNAWKHKIPEHYDEEVVEEAWDDLCNQILQKLMSMGSDDEPNLEVVDEILEKTESVVLYRSKMGQVVVTIEADAHNGETRTFDFEFSAKQWNDDSSSLLQHRYYSVYGERLDINEATWDELRDGWEQMKEDGGFEAQSDKHAVLRHLRNELQLKLELTDDTDELKTAEFVGMEDDGVYLVPSRTIDTIRTDYDGKSPDLGQLSQWAQTDGLMVSTTVNKMFDGDRSSYWPFDAEKLELYAEKDLETDDDADIGDGVNGF